MSRQLRISLIASYCPCRATYPHDDSRRSDEEENRTRIRTGRRNRRCRGPCVRVTGTSREFREFRDTEYLARIQQLFIIYFAYKPYLFLITDRIHAIKDPERLSTK